MLMMEGIGRTGYRLIAAMILLLGLLGLALATYGAKQGLWPLATAGGVSSAVTLVVLFAMALVTPNPARASTQAGLTEPPSANAWGGLSREGIDIVGSAPAGRGLQPTPEARVSSNPEPTRAPLRRLDPAAWPNDRDDKSDWTREMEARQEAEDRASARRRRDAFTDRYTQATPQVREILMAADGPQAVKSPRPDRPVAPVADEGRSRGKCGGCGTILLAPKRRPIRLRCPTCQRVTTLQS